MGKVRFSLSPCVQFFLALKHTVAFTVPDSAFMSLGLPTTSGIPSTANMENFHSVMEDFPLCRALCGVCKNIALRFSFITKDVQYTFQYIWITAREQFRVHGWWCSPITTISRTSSSSQTETLNLVSAGSPSFFPAH